MEVESVDISHQQEDGRISGKDNNVDSASTNNDNDANMTLQFAWEESDTRDSAKESKTDDSNLSKEGLKDTTQEGIEVVEEEDVKKYYVVDDNILYDEEYSNEQSTEASKDGTTHTNALKRKASELGWSSDEDFMGFDEEPSESSATKQPIKKIKEEYTSEEDKKAIEENNKIENLDTESTSVNKNENSETTNKEKITADMLVNCSPTKEINENHEYMSVETSEDKPTEKKKLNEQTGPKKADDKKTSQTNSKDSNQKSKTSTPTPAPTPPSKNLIYRKPLEMGWKRELVYRAVPSSGKDKCEAYYFTPSGKKLRTKSEIAQYLTPGLSIENFTFAREPLGFGLDGEIIRSAKITKTTDPVLSSKKPSVDNNLGKRIPKPKAPKGASPPPQGWTPAKAVKASSVITSPRPVAQIKNSEDTESRSKSASKSGKQTKK